MITHLLKSGHESAGQAEWWPVEKRTDSLLTGVRNRRSRTAVSYGAWVDAAGSPMPAIRASAAPSNVRQVKSIRGRGLLLSVRRYGEPGSEGVPRRPRPGHGQ